MTLNRILYGNVTFFDLIIALSILAGAIIIAKVIPIYLRRFLKDKVSREYVEIVGKATAYSIIAVALFIALPVLGIRLSGLLVAGGIVGVALGFASQSVVSNLISGLFLMVERPIKIGDGVDIDGTVGMVDDVKIMSTTLRTYDGLYVRLPNEKVFKAQITNFVSNVARRFEYVVGIRYSDDADKAIDIITKLIDEHPLALKNPAPQAFVDNLGDNSVNILIRIWSPATEWYGVKMELLWKIKQALEKGNIQIPFPQRVVWSADS
jgi:small-conductance mechanosensitive channel